jgi:hypothetical protein
MSASWSNPENIYALRVLPPLTQSSPPLSLFQKGGKGSFAPAPANGGRAPIPAIAYTCPRCQMGRKECIGSRPLRRRGIISSGALSRKSRLGRFGEKREGVSPRVDDGLCIGLQ